METAQATLLQKKILGLRLRTWLLLLLASPFLIWGFLNCLFSTSIGTGLLEGQIRKRIGLPCQIGGVTWSPWGGVNVRDFGIRLPDGSESSSEVLQIKKVNIDPSWTSLSKGQKRFESLKIDGCVGTISIEQIKELMARYHGERPVLVVRPSQKKPKPELESQSSSEAPKENPDQLPRPKPPPEAGPQNKEESSPVVDSVPVEDFEGVVLLNNVDLRLYSENHPQLDLKVSGFGAEIPIWGRERDGELRIGALEFGEYLADVKEIYPLRWDGHSVLFEGEGLKILGVDLEIEAEVRAASGFPMGLEISLPNQQLDMSPIYPDRRAPVSVSNLSSRNTFQGYLLRPRSIRGRSVTTFKNLVLHDPKDGGDTRFGRGSAVFVLNSSGVVANDVRAIGDEDAVLANGFMTTGGDAAATVRIVSSPERADSHEKRIRTTSPSLSMKFNPLVTPDREYRDIRIESRSNTLAVDLGTNQEWVPLFPTMRAILGSPPSKQQLP